MKKIMSFQTLRGLSLSEERKVWRALSDEISKQTIAFIKFNGSIEKATHYPGLNHVLGVTFDASGEDSLGYLGQVPDTVLPAWKAFQKRIQAKINAVQATSLPVETVDYNYPIRIVGAGVSGLCLGMYFAKNGFKNVEIHEKRPEELAATRFQNLVIRDPKELEKTLGRDVIVSLRKRHASDVRVGGLMTTIGTFQDVLKKEAKSLGVRFSFGDTVTQETIDLWRKEQVTLFSCVGSSATLGNDDDYIHLETTHQSKMAHVWSMVPADDSYSESRIQQFGGEWHFRTDRLMTEECKFEFNAFITFMKKLGVTISEPLLKIHETQDFRHPPLLRLLSHNMLLGASEIESLRSRYFSKMDLPITKTFEFTIEPKVRVHAIQNDVVGFGDILGGPHPLTGLGVRRILRSLEPALTYVQSCSGLAASSDAAQRHADLLDLRLYLESAKILAYNCFEGAFSNPENWN